MTFSQKTPKLNIILLLFFDIISVYLSIEISFKLRFGVVGSIPKFYQTNMIYYVLLIALAAVMSNFIMHCYNTIWRYFCYKDILRLLGSVLFTTVFVVLVDNFIGLELPLELFILIPLLTFLFMLLVRTAPKACITIKKALLSYEKNKRQNCTRALIYGAGEAGNYLLTKIKQNADLLINPVGFIDDNKAFRQRKIGGVFVYGGGDSLEWLIKSLEIQEVIIAIPTADTDFIKNIFMRCKKYNVDVKRYGSLSDITAEDFQNATIKNIRFEELLRRESVLLDTKALKSFVKDKVVLVTGGVGSIGSEICRQVLKFGVKKLVVFDINENGLFYIQNEFWEAGYKDIFDVRLGSIRDRTRLKEIFKEYNPDIVFHAAAHKHVPMMEINPKEAIKNNVLGTINVANEAVFNHIEKFILISTDKAVNPTNIMGATKRIAEIAIQIINKISDTDFAAVRFGNVLGSNGSVVPFFERQIEQGGPVTVTHPDMKRYFMTIPEAVQLVLEAGAMASGGEIFVLDMGEPVRIYDLACDLIKMHGLVPNKDIKIIFTGLRPGEKLFEEISLVEEDATKTKNSKIFICKPVEHNSKEFSQHIKELENMVKTNSIEKVFDIVQQLVSTFNHNDSVSDDHKVF